VKHFLFLSTHNLATNPRLVKEIRLAVENGFKVTTICFVFDNWSQSINDQLLKSFSDVTFILIPAGRKPIGPWLVSSMMERLLRVISKYFSLGLSLRAQAVSRRNNLLLKAIRKVDKPDCVIGHNPGALYATYFAAQQFRCRSGFDVEDYHPGESNPPQVQRLTKELMRELLPHFDYVSFASAPIMKQFVEDDEMSKIKSKILLTNAFPKNEFEANFPFITGKLKMVWFSQYISFNRGLEGIIDSLKKYPDEMELHLYGHVNPDFDAAYLFNNKQVFLHGVKPQKELHKELSQFDIGLALEPGKDLNNELAVSNKMMAYLQSGLFVVATNTEGHAQMLANLPGHGILIKKDFSDVMNQFRSVIDTIEYIRNNRAFRFNDAMSYCWEKNATVLSREWKK
jgi:hypothetical protein